jgi:PAS domain S-box-containing protein
MRHSPHSSDFNTPISPAFRIVAIYCITGCLWIFVTDQFINHWFQNSSALITHVQTFKGWFFVVVTAAMLYRLISREIHFSHRTTTDLETALAELQTAEATLKQSEERFRVFMDNSPAAHWITDSEGRLKYVSQTYLRTFQLPPDFLNRSLFDIFPQEIAQIYLDHIRTVSEAGQTLETIEPGIAVDGQQKQFLAYKFPLPQADNTPEVGGVAIDITERILAEQELQRSEEQLRLAFDFAQIGGWDWVVQTNQVTWNRNHFLLLGLNPDTDVASFDNWRDRVHPDDVAAIEAALEYALQNHTTYEGEYRVIHPDGSVRWVVGKGKAIYDGSGKPTRMIGVILETTDHKQLEQTLWQQTERLQLINVIAQRIRQSLNLKEILNTTAVEVKSLLSADRVIVYQFASDRSGKIVAESVAPSWRASLGAEIEDTCFKEGAGIDYLQGKKRAIANVDDAGLTDCHLQLLKQFEVRANLVVPILLMGDSKTTPEHLWGLLVVHQCEAPREWHPDQLDLLEQIALQLAIASCRPRLLNRRK